PQQDFPHSTHQKPQQGLALLLVTKGHPADFQRSKLNNARCAGHGLPMQLSCVLTRKPGSISRFRPTASETQASFIRLPCHCPCPSNFPPTLASHIVQVSAP